MNLPENLDAWVLAGQSNMQGCGLIEGALQPDERVFCFTTAGNWDIACEPLHRLWESFTPVHQNFMRPGVPEDRQHLSDEELARIDDRERVTGAGLGLSFGRDMADALKKPVGLIPAAHGGTSLEQWSHKLKDQGGESLYGAMLERIERSGANVKGILWYQGESDCVAEHAPTYSERFDAWISALRSDLGMPDLPVIVVQLGRVIVWEVGDKWWDMVRESLRTLPERVPNTAVTSAVDLGLDDSIHIATDELVRLGSRMARLALRLMGRTDIPSGPQPKRVERVVDPRGMNCLRLTLSGVTGSLTPKSHMSGFQLCDGEGKTTTANLIMDARVDRHDPTSIRITSTMPVDDDTYLAYGLGINPYCNVRDEADMPLCAFAPMKIS